MRKIYVEKRRRYFTGDPLETGGTSIKGKGAAPGIRWLFDRGYFEGANTIMDYGAGKFARNADYLRERGLNVFAYDPFNGTNVDGWVMGNVSLKLPSSGSFDIVFTSFVLNVVPYHIEDVILNDIKTFNPRKEFHVTRNMDIFDTVKRAIERRDPLVYGFYQKEFQGPQPPTDEDILEFCYFGVQTSRGFQRIPELEDKDFSLIRKTAGFKVYEG